MVCLGERLGLEGEFVGLGRPAALVVAPRGGGWGRGDGRGGAGGRRGLVGVAPQGLLVRLSSDLELLLPGGLTFGLGGPRRVVGLVNGVPEGMLWRGVGALGGLLQLGGQGLARPWETLLHPWMGHLIRGPLPLVGAGTVLGSLSGGRVQRRRMGVLDDRVFSQRGAGSLQLTPRHLSGVTPLLLLHLSPHVVT